MLIVDDQASVREVFRLMLEALGAEVVDSESVAMALASSASVPFDIVWLDLSMPVIDGIRGVSLFRADPVLSSSWMIALTASTERRAELMAAGFNDVVGKPASLAQLRAAIAGVRRS